MVDVKIIGLGEGKFVTGPGYFRKARAVFIEPAPIAGPVGKDASGSGLVLDALVDGATVIVLGSREAADVLIEAINEAFTLPDQDASTESKGTAPAVEPNS